MSEEHSKLKKIHTFQEDYEHARGTESTSHKDDKTEPASPPTPATKSTKPQPTPAIKTPPPITKSTPEPAPSPVTPISLPKKSVPATEKLDNAAIAAKPNDNMVLSPERKVTDAPTKAIDTTAPIPVMSGGDRINLLETDGAIETGSIITDRKRERFHLLPAMWEALLQWLGKEKREYKERAVQREASIPKVVSAEKRKEVLKKAAQGSVFGNRSDDLKVTKPSTPTPKPQEPKADLASSVVLEKEKAQVTPSWSHYEGQESVTPTPDKPAEPVPVATPAPEPEPEPTVQPEPVVVPEPTPKPAAKPEPTPTPLPAEPVTKPKERVEEPKAAPVAVRQTATKSSSFNLKKILLFSVILLVAGAGGIGATLLAINIIPSFLTKEEPVTVTEPTPDMPFTPISEQPSVTLTNRNTFFTELENTEINSSGKVVTFFSVTLTDSQQILNTLSLQMPGSFIRTINTIQFGQHRSGAPVILLDIASFEAAFGGILNWENNILSDLNPWFGDTFGTSTPRFIDEVIGNTAVRVLRDANEKERVTYGFTNQNRLIITTDRATFKEVMDTVR